MSIIFAYILTGCNGDLFSKKVPKEKLVARVNNYEMTVQDFNNGINSIALEDIYTTQDQEKLKEDILEGMIAQELMLQEAERLNLDKNKDFMKEIENYWKQALLQSLMKKKIKEFSAQVRIDDLELKHEYELSKKKLLVQTVTFSDKESALILAKSVDDFDKTLESLNVKVVSAPEPEWWEAGELSQEIEAIIFNLKMGEVSLPFSMGKNWAIAKILKEESLVKAPLLEELPKLRELIKLKKTQEAMINWIDSLRKNAVIVQNKEVLDTIKLNSGELKIGEADGK